MAPGLIEIPIPTDDEDRDSFRIWLALRAIWEKAKLENGDIVTRLDRGDLSTPGASALEDSGVITKTDWGPDPSMFQEFPYRVNPQLFNWLAQAALDGRKIWSQRLICFITPNSRQAVVIGGMETVKSL